jgi:hypothetical protein
VAHPKKEGHRSELLISCLPYGQAYANHLAVPPRTTSMPLRALTIFRYEREVFNSGRPL